MTAGADDRLVGDVQSVLVTYDYAAARPMPVPDDWRRLHRPARGTFASTPMRPGWQRPPRRLNDHQEIDGRTATTSTCSSSAAGMSYVGAIRAAQLGLSVGLVERDRLGGTCLNRGCIPSKALLETADLLHRVTEQGAEFGLAGHEGISLDYGALAKRRDAVIDKHVGGVEFLMKKNKVTVLRGNGVLTGPTSVRVSGGESGDVEATADNLILATGSAPRSLPGPRARRPPDHHQRRGAHPRRRARAGHDRRRRRHRRGVGQHVPRLRRRGHARRVRRPDRAARGPRGRQGAGARLQEARHRDPRRQHHRPGERSGRREGDVSFQIATKDGAKRTDLTSDVILVAVGRRPLTDDIGLEAIDGREARSRLREGRRVHAHRRRAPVRHRRHRAGLRAGARRQPRGGGGGRAPGRPRPGAGPDGPHAARHVLPAADRIGRHEPRRRRRRPAARSRSARSRSARSARRRSSARSTASPSSSPMRTAGSCSARTSSARMPATCWPSRRWRGWSRAPPPRSR